MASDSVLQPSENAQATSIAVAWAMVKTGLSPASDEKALMEHAELVRRISQKIYLGKDKPTP